MLGWVYPPLGSSSIWTQVCSPEYSRHGATFQRPMHLVFLGSPFSTVFGQQRLGQSQPEYSRHTRLQFQRPCRFGVPQHSFRSCK
jgi:hypothetical protein